MVGHKETVNRQKIAKESRKRKNANHCDVLNTYHRRLKRAMISCGHSKMYKRRRMWQSYINLTCARKWIRDKGYSTFSEIRKSGEYSWLTNRNPKKVSDYRSLVYDEIVKRTNVPLGKRSEDCREIYGVQGFDVSTF